MNQTNIEQYDEATWPILAATRIQNAIQKTLLERGSCDVMLTGGRSAAQLYKAWRNLPDFQQMTGVSFFFGDERCVPQDHPESNYGMAMQTLFQNGIPAGCSVFRMEADAINLEAAAQRYADLLPDSVDVLLLGVGEDGHVASLFPNNIALQEQRRGVLLITGPKPPFERLTIAPKVITRARSVFVLATGSTKAVMLSAALKNPNDFVALPARLTLGGTWLMDHV
jgi:6-phosphogluconolactonase